MSELTVLLIPADLHQPCRVVDVAEDDESAWADTLGVTYVEVCAAAVREVQLVVDEEGLLTGRPGNPRASIIRGGPIVGDALVLGRGPGGETCDVPQVYVDLVQDLTLGVGR